MLLLLQVLVLVLGRRRVVIRLVTRGIGSGIEGSSPSMGKDEEEDEDKDNGWW